MNCGQVIHVAAWLLQLGVAFYALTLGRRLGSARVAWLVFSGLSLLAIAYLLLPFSPFLGSLEARVESDLLCAMTSVLLALGIAHFDGTLRKLLQRRAAKPAQVQPQPDLVSQAVAAATEAATVAAAEAQQKITQLESAVADSAKAREVVEKNYLESQAQAQELVAVNEELRQTLTSLQAERSEQTRIREATEKTHQDQLVASRQAGMVDATAPVILHIKDVLTRINSLSLTADHLAKSRIAPLVQLTRTISAGVRKNGNATVVKPETGKSRKSKAPVRPPSAPAPAPSNLPWIAREISADQVLLQRKIDSVKRKLESLNETLAIQQIMDKLTRLPDAESAEAPAMDGALVDSQAPVLPSELSEPLQGVAEETPEPAALEDTTESAKEAPGADAIVASEELAETSSLEAAAPAAG